ncbi:mannosyl-3-phosphoglycerate phosphatase [Arcobacter sp. CECT 8983]|uniref:HAD-IIB family hydrolase n=1 Tax=Arcobacter sp. CECT 8983 TaxID=2044508 RepID=UPI00100A6D45|nr:HAD-IIB family hydrolase [Arcobacter sp. CECT 8983]RXJ89725.1 mannosyl-3-phosphoglycerate phosphatase [Arcobacter sp. CECT 8983]
MKKIIFTDLDGTFLNHHDYSYKESLNSLNRLIKYDIPVIFTTSKTRSEVEELHKQLAIDEPFIVENGAALFIPKGYKNLNLSFLESFNDKYYYCKIGEAYSLVSQFYKKYKDEFNLIGFSSMSIEQIQELTLLDYKKASLAAKRDFTEPFIIKDEKKVELLKEKAIVHGLTLTKGGRFYHIIGAKQDKGKAVKKAIEIFEKEFNSKLFSIALGDGENDLPMLEVVDLPIAIKNHKGLFVETKNKKILKSTYKGAKGFKEMITKCLENY